MTPHSKSPKKHIFKLEINLLTFCHLFSSASRKRYQCELDLIISVLSLVVKRRFDEIKKNVVNAINLFHCEGRQCLFYIDLISINLKEKQEIVFKELYINPNNWSYYINLRRIQSNNGYVSAMNRLPHCFLGL